MSRRAKDFAFGFIVCALFASAMGAGPDKSYAEAVQAVQGEYTARLVLMGNKSADQQQRLEACQKRAMYWVNIMEQFKP